MRLHLAKRTGALLLLFAGLLGLYVGVARPWFRTWGTTPEERTRSMPGDEVLPGATDQETRAITVAAPADRVFAWLAQTGQDRGGFFSYELLEDLVGCEMENLDHLDPSLQHWQIGDKLWMYPAHKLNGVGHAPLVAMVPGRALTFGTRQIGTSLAQPPDATWTFYVEPTASPGASRLYMRGRAMGGIGLGAQIFDDMVFEPMHFAMERRMMEVVKARAEGRPVTRAREDIMVGIWFAVAIAGVAAAVAVLIGRQTGRRLGVFLAAGLLFQLLTFVQPTPFIGVPLTLALLAAGWMPRRRWQSLIEKLSLLTRTSSGIEAGPLAGKGAI
ncbi:MAG TPA: hypothetical protein VGF45_05865 [Polyangia bacterium]